MSNNTNQNLNNDISENQEPTPEEIRIVLKPLFDKFNQVLQRYGLKDVEVVDFTLMVSSKVVREATEQSKTILDEYNDILKETGFSDVYKDLEIIDFTIAATSLVRQKKRELPLGQITDEAIGRVTDEGTGRITRIERITDERREQILLFLKDSLRQLECDCIDPETQKCIPCRGKVVD